MIDNTAKMITHVIVELEYPTEEKYWIQEDYSDEYYGIGKPLVRCKDCKYYQQGSRNSDDWLWCMMNHHYTDEEKYCAWAERADGKEEWTE